MSGLVAGDRFTERRRREALDDAVAFLAERYGLDAQQRKTLANVPIRWRRGGRRKEGREREREREEGTGRGEESHQAFPGQIPAACLA